MSRQRIPSPHTYPSCFTVHAIWIAYAWIWLMVAAANDAPHVSDLCSGLLK